MASNPLDFLKAIQGLQRNMGDMEEKLRGIQVTGSAGGDMVEVVLNGHLDVVGVRIAPEAIDREEREMLEDLIPRRVHGRGRQGEGTPARRIQFRARRHAAAAGAVRSLTTRRLSMTSLDRVITALAKLPGLGHKSAARLAYYLLRADPSYVRSLAADLTALRERIRPCLVCGAYTEAERCEICADPTRDPVRVCVVEQPQDIATIEATASFAAATTC